MKKEVQLKLPPEIALDQKELFRFLHQKYKIPEETLYFQVLKKSIDGRNRQVFVHLDLLISDKTSLNAFGFN